MRQIVLDTETTGLEASRGHRIIEIGCVELVNRKLTGQHYHQYINPQREVDQGAIEVHGITDAFLADKPLFKQIVGDFIEFVDGAELIIHNAPFDVGFINAELARLPTAQQKVIEDRCGIVDTLQMARKKHPGQRNSLDALCGRYLVDNSQRDLHGALLDAEILADVYLAITGGQTAMLLGSGGDGDRPGEEGGEIRRVASTRQALPVIRASAEELEAHARNLDNIDKASGGQVRWRQLEAE